MLGVFKIIEVVSLIVGLLAIIVSIVAIMLSYQYSKRAENLLNQVDLKADKIEKDVRDRIDDLVKRAAPTQEEQVMSGVMGDFFKAILSDKDTLAMVMKESMKQHKD